MECYFCKKNIQEVDFKNLPTIRNYISGAGKIRHRDKTGLCATHQRHIARSIKRARHVGLLSHVSKS